MEIDNRVSTRIKESTLAQWGYKDGQYWVVLNLAGCWGEAKEIIDRWRGYDFTEEIEEPQRWPAYDKYVDTFCDSLAASYLIERICIERNRQKIRLKRDHCKPCCINHIMIAMHNHVHQAFTYTPKSDGTQAIRENLPGDFTKRSKD
jgi:hypothetical protein